MRRLLEAVLAHLHETSVQAALRSYITNLLKMFPAASADLAVFASECSNVLVEPLSERELLILQLIAAGLSNQQIAQQLVIAVGTVKWHTNNLYGKLGVRSRTQALVRARELRLL
jgi:LuxR family maltose regulon positive regulatory protein